MRKVEGSVNQNRQVYRLAKRVTNYGGADSKGTIEFPVNREGTIERMRIRIYIGPQLDLKLVPYIRRKGSQSEEGLIAYADEGKKYLDGDDDVLDFTLSIPVFRDDAVCVDYENMDAVNSYDFYCDIEIDHMGGAYRLPMYGSGGGR